MTHTTQATAVRGALLAAVALLAASPASAAARTAPGDTHRGDWLYLTVTRGDARYAETRGTLLRCGPPRGHARAAEACAELTAAGGDIGAIPQTKDVFCPMIYAPVTVHARGEWHGRLVAYRETFSNACAMGARTGAVFALDG
ncbi:SSI family serine proteinase inhibitor [Streptomyces sp. NPDC051636]|uniref:SSI family serine proteinase inhibitor n=1 Tax=Streptomyces sp. NPDC051636 TaxID=3365663 RepID=UPI0037A6C67B